MKSVPMIRSGVSSLTDAELILLDAVSTAKTDCRRLREKEFSSMWNRPSHGLDDKSLDHALHRFEADGLITLKACMDFQGQVDHEIGLTEAGGALWESERRPDWTRYILDYHRKNRISLYGYSLEICEQFFDVACRSQLCNYDGGWVIKAVAHRSLIYWRPAQPVHLLCARVSSKWVSTTDWTYFESHRAWWRSADEIATIPPHGTTFRS